MTIELNTVTSGYSVGLVNANFQKLENYINESLLNRDNVATGQPNQMENALDMNGYPIINIGAGSSLEDTLLTIGIADDRYVKKDEPWPATNFEPISWHSQVINSNVVIPEDKNAWSFGPSMTIAQGVDIEVGDNSYWTISDGSISSSPSLDNYDEGTL